MSFFNAEPKRRGVKLLIAGIPAVGKSSMAAKLPKAAFIDLEDGLLGINPKPRREYCGTWPEVLKIVMGMGTTPDKTVQTLVIDSADWAERRLIEHVCQRHDKGSIEAFNYGKGYAMLGEQWGAFLDALDAIARQGVSVVLTGHTHVKRENPPDQPDGFDRYTLRQTKHVAPLTMEWCDAHVFATFDEKVVTGGDGRKRGMGGKQRVVHSERCAAFDAKNRFGWPTRMTFEEFIANASNLIEPEPAPPPELVEEVVVEPTAFEDARQFLLNGCTKEQAKKAQVRIVDLAAKGSITSAEMDQLLVLVAEKL